MGRIIQLSQHVANQIAAGEVVERPSSVVKELVENSIDADSSSIEVRIKDGGFSYMIVQDDGHGMDEIDIELAIRRYATSKLTSVSDLDRLHSFGFRGEALPSIASISSMAIISRPIEQSHAAKVLIEGGELREKTKAGFACGTRIEVRDLFYNVPARLKFAKSRRVETAEIDRLLRAFSFVHESIAFRFFVDEKLVFSSGGESEQKLDRAVSLLGEECEGYLYTFEKQIDSLTVHAVIGAPMAQRRDTRGIHFFVNNRLVSDKKLMIAVKTAFRSLIEIGHQPVCILKIYLPPDEVDVNVHPRKAEVRFRDENAVMSTIIDEMTLYLAKTPWLNDKRVRAPIGTAAPLRLQNVSRPQFNYGDDDRAKPLSFSLRPISSAKSFDPPLIEKRLLTSTSFESLRVIGQVCATYLLAEGDNGLVIIDQHAAHERVHYERLIKKGGKNIASSPLLIPITVPLGFGSMSLFDEYREDIFALGFSAERCSDREVVITSHPDIIKNGDVGHIFTALLNDLEQTGRALIKDKIFHEISASIACHAAIRAGQRLSKEEIEALLSELDGIDFSAHCPHGRPIVKSFSEKEMKLWFDRT